MTNAFGLPEMLIMLVVSFFWLVIGLGFPITLIILLLQINKRLKSIEDFLKRPA